MYKDADAGYYIGQFIDWRPHGKGALYYKNNTLLYEGDFVNGQFEGKGKLIDENGNYYVGEFLNGLKHGKGKEYYKDNTIKYEGNYFEGYMIDKELKK